MEKYQILERSNLIFLRYEHLPDEQVYASIVLAVGPLGNITVKLIREELDTLTAGQLHEFLKEHICPCAFHSSFALMDSETKRIVRDDTYLRDAYCVKILSRPPWCIIPVLSSSLDPSPLSTYRTMNYTITDEGIPNSGSAHFYFYADVECKLSDVCGC